MTEEKKIKEYIDGAEKELREIITDLIIFDYYNDNNGEYELHNRASGFNTLLKYARKWQEYQESGLTASEAIDALLAGKMIRRKTWEEGQYVRLNDRGDIVNQNGDCCCLQLLQCERPSAIYSSNQAETLRSELCLKLWEEAK